MVWSSSAPHMVSVTSPQLAASSEVAPLVEVVSAADPLWLPPQAASDSAMAAAMARLNCFFMISSPFAASTAHRASICCCADIAQFIATSIIQRAGSFCNTLLLQCFFVFFVQSVRTLRGFFSSSAQCCAARFFFSLPCGKESCLCTKKAAHRGAAGGLQNCLYNF